MIKKTLKFFINDYLSYGIRDVQRKIFPTAKQKKLIRKELELKKRRKIFFQSFIQKDDLCFDVGANVGNRVLPLLEIGAKVIAVEPQNICYSILKYRFGKKIEIVKKGLGERECFEDFYISDATVISSFSKEWINAVKNNRFSRQSWSKIVRVEMTTCDKLIEKYGLPKFIKIDVEGYELNVLKGLSSSVKLISFEYTVPEQVQRIAECLDQIHKNGSNIECNYSKGESMELELMDWIPVQRMKEYILTEKFIDSGFGDIYVQQING